ncbi:MAG: hypothetical protein IT379_41915 [Deltaproteobacteria bacterium]|nr:hypothetical protein [Deltaproteobacteria bacterium]
MSLPTKKRRTTRRRARGRVLDLELQDLVAAERRRPVPDDFVRRVLDGFRARVAKERSS